MTQALLERRLLGLLSMARKSGHIAIGYDQVKAAAGSGKIAWRALGRDSVVHVSLPPGKLAKAFAADAARYRGFRHLIPREWDDIGHEIKMPSSEDKANKESGKRP